ncbi:MAG: GNAT family N-acetyltransferase [Gammaproteobacteria bacterium]|jgi:RimJ/RimL family protein N-acetyltransferase|nr:GNAT family N-acetyltransferase [Gammaproteobacteria bacterium]
MSAIPTRSPVPPRKTQRLRLDAYRPEDRDAFLGLVLDPRVMARVDGPADRDAALALFARICGESGEPGEPECMAWAVFEHDTYVGHVFLVWIDVDPEIGFVFAPAAWGRGLATEAAGEVLAFARDSLGLARLTASVDLQHAASRRVLEKIGLHRVAQEQDRDGAYLRYAWQAGDCP